LALHSRDSHGPGLGEIIISKLLRELELFHAI
jgi:hypothetical protein